MIDKILQSWIDNVPETALLADELKLKLAQATVDVLLPANNTRSAPQYPEGTPKHLRTNTQTRYG